MNDKVKKLIRAHVRENMPDEIKRLASIARMDVLFGPYAAQDDFEDGKPYPGFVAATDQITAWLDAHAPRELWVDLEWDGIMDSEPKAYQDGDEWIEPCWEDICRVERKEILRATFGELAEYL